MPYKRFSPISDTFLVTPFGSVFRQVEFFNSHGIFRQQPHSFRIAANPPIFSGVLLRNRAVRLRSQVALDEPAGAPRRRFPSVWLRSPQQVIFVDSELVPNTRPHQQDKFDWPWRRRCLGQGRSQIREALSLRRTGPCNCREVPGVVSSFRLVRSGDIGRLYFLRFTVVRLLISVAICFAIGLFVLAQGATAI